MVLLALAQLAHAAVGPVTRLLAISGHQNYSMYTSGAALVLWLGLTAILTPFYGVMGVAVAVFVALTARAGVFHWMVVRYLRISILVIVRDLEKKPATAEPINNAD